MRSLYSLIRSVLTVEGQGFLTRVLYRTGLKPSVQRSTGAFDKGIVVLSADFEMAWAFRYSKKQKDHAISMGMQERSNVPVILTLLEKYQVPCTWATVGHLMLKSCMKINGSIHEDMLRPGFFENRNWRFQTGDWYQHDPGTNYQQDPAWYAPDLIEKILHAGVRHEIGCHTFSHIDFTDANCSSELAEAELSKCREVAGERNLELKSLVFPGGTEGNHEVVKAQGFSCYRKPMAWDIGMPYLDSHGLVAIPSSYGLDKPEYNWSAKTCLKIAKSYIDKAARYKKVCHLWFHPSMHPWYLENVFPGVLQHIAESRQKGSIEVNTMRELSDRFKTRMR